MVNNPKKICRNGDNMTFMMMCEYDIGQITMTRNNMK